MVFFIWYITNIRQAVENMKNNYNFSRNVSSDHNSMFEYIVISKIACIKEHK